MSNVTRFENLKQIVKIVQPDFDQLASIHGAVNYKVEASYALQILQDNDFLASVAMSDQDSFKRAIINVAAIGLTLSPVEKLAYLVPRDKKVRLDISYMGYIKLATDIGAIKWASAEIVREKDVYEFQGVNREPVHKFNPFKDRGEIVGGYCLAKTHDGEFILSQMSGEEILSIRDRSQSWKSHIKDGKQTPWKSDENEMIKKTLIKRAWKSWPRTDTRNRLEQAIDVTNQADPIDFTAIEDAKPVDDQRTKDFELIRSHLVTLNRTEEKYIEHLCLVNNREIKQLTDLTDLEISQAMIMLNQLVENKLKKDAANEVAG